MTDKEKSIERSKWGRKRWEIPGYTYPYREELKRIGCKWHPIERKWRAPVREIYEEALKIINRNQ